MPPPESSRGRGRECYGVSDRTAQAVNAGLAYGSLAAAIGMPGGPAKAAAAGLGTGVVTAALEWWRGGQDSEQPADHGEEG